MARANNRLTIRLDVFIIVIFVILIIGTASLIGIISFRNGRSAVDALAERMLDSIESRVSQALDSFLALPHALNRINADAFRNGQMEIRDFPHIRQQFLSQIHAVDSVETCAFGSEAGEFISAGKRGPGRFDSAVADKTLDNHYRVYLLDEAGNPGDVLSIIHDYDPKPRPWYHAALAAKGPAWSPVYIWASKENIGISAVLSVRDRAGTVLGVQQSALSLVHIGNFLKTVREGTSGLIFVMERSGLLIASSTPEPVVRGNPEKPDNPAERIPALESDSPLIRNAAAHVKARTVFTNITERQRMCVDLDAKPHFLSIAPFTDNHGLDWLVCIAIPESDLMGPIQSNLRSTLSVSFFALAGAIVLASLLTQWTTRPLKQLTESVNRMRQGVWGKTSEDIHITEVKMLAISFNEMTEQLHESIETLEARVQARTNDLSSVNDRLNAEIAERRQAEDARMELEHRLMQARKADSLARMAGAIAHHFNNLISVVMGNLELVMISLPIDSTFRNNMIEAMNASRRAAALSGHMLAYLGQSLSDRMPIVLTDICREALSHIQSTLPETISIRINVADTHSLIQGNAGQIRQVVTNIVTNAVESIGDQPTEIAVDIGVKTPAEISDLRFYPQDWKPKAVNYACISVQDMGTGMDADTLEKVFDPFFTTRFTGRGLGLPVALGIVKSHGGAMTVESEPGKGSLFCVYLPIAAEAPPGFQKAESSAQQPARKPGLILVVDDEPMVRKMVQAMLTHIGWEVLTASDGSEALKVFQEKQADIQSILLDLTMPGMDGWETLKALRHIRPNVAVILASGYDEARVMSGEHTEQPQCFLHKPYRIADLKAALSKAIEHSPN